VEGVKNYAILTLDPQGCVISWTDAAERLKGYSAGKSWREFRPLFHRRGHRPRASGRGSQGRRAGWPFRGSRLAGAQRRLPVLADVSLTAMRGETGELRGFSKITHDITGRKQSEDKILQSEETFRALLESAPDALVVSDAQGTIALINAQAERMFGYGRPEIVGGRSKRCFPFARRRWASESS